MDNSRITILVGAGAMCECTSLNTLALTDLVIEKEQCYIDLRTSKDVSLPVIAELKSMLTAHYRKDESVSFEDILHALEMMESYFFSCKPSTAKSFKSIFPIFTKPSMHYDELATYRAKDDLIVTIIDDISKYERGWNKPANQWFVNFIQDIVRKSRADIFSLNYDTWIEQILGEGFIDGFIPFDAEYRKFDVNRLFNRNEIENTVCHLHGQICFAFNHPRMHGKYTWDRSAFKAKDFDTILSQNKYPRYDGTITQTQSGESISTYPIISGLRKRDKTNIPPFDAYYNYFYQSILKNKKLLIIGYGFNDLHINSILNQFVDMHPNDGEAVVISFIAPTERMSDLYDCKAISNNTKQFYYGLFREPDMSLKLLGRDRLDFLESVDKRKIIYWIGFKDSVSRYGERILKVFG